MSSTEMIQIVNPEGELVNKRNVPKIPEKLLIEAYEKMVLTRTVDTKGISLQRQGRLGNYTSSLGHEATQVGSTIALKKEDWIFPLYRDVGVVLSRGVPPVDLFNRFLGNAKDTMKGRDLPNLYSWKSYHIVSNAAPIASHLPLAVGFGMASRIKHDHLATICFFGDGATSSGEFHVAMNFAGVFKAPTIFVCENNQYAISLHVTKQTASKNIAMKAEAYGFEGIPVDGNDLVAVHQAVSQAREKAAKGEGPTLIECYTYRISDHSTSDDAKRYRKDDEIQFWKQRDPVRRLFLYLQKRGLWGEKKEASLKAELESKVNAALAESERIGPPDKDSMLTDIYAGNPTNLRFSDLE